MKNVTVGCKLPNGVLVEIHGYKIKLNGSNSSNIIGGFGITEGVDSDFFHEWMTLYESMPFIKKGLVFGLNKTDDVRKESLVRESIKNGLERLSVSKMPQGLSIAS